MVSALRRRGWSLDRVRGSHHVMVKPGRAEIITVPVHGNAPLKPGLLSAILRLSGLSRSDF
jgi:predicted RNA binding protein YcfA (HicA-like mRNA interferase family)